MIDPSGPSGDLADEVRVELLRASAATGRVPQVPELARALGRAEAEVRAALGQLAAARVLILAPHDGDIWGRQPVLRRAVGFSRRGVGSRLWDNIGFT